ncbi:N-acetylmuramoyl-L-alanine amidase [bacterium]|nr:MAG: N-acetylmuramoyl-L-alanine amidase [bacterium]
MMFLLGLAVGPKTVCIDPGHPSEVGVGTQGSKLTELRANWTIAVKLRDLLRKDGFRVVMTKQVEREFVRNRRRAEIANEAKADLMVRLHCDGSPRPGFAVYYPDRQGRAEGRTGPSAEVIRRTAPLARRFYAALARGLKGDLDDQGLMSDTRTAVGGKQGALTGSIFSKVPVVLVEMATITLKRDEAFMLSQVGQRKMAEGLRAGVRAALKG